jgi:hypothetical protein
MVVGDVIPNQAAQMRFIQGNDMVEELSATASNPTLRESILPRTRRRQKRRKPARCQETTVSGLTMIKALVHPGQSRRSRIQNSLSAFLNLGRGFFRFRTPSCWRKAMISRLRLYREQKKARRIVRNPDNNGIMSLDLYHRGRTSSAFKQLHLWR